MGDMREHFEALNEARKEQKRVRLKLNMHIFNDCEFNFSYNGGHVVFFRADGYPKVDYYLTTNKWKVGGARQKVLYGDATRFLAWYRRQRLPIKAINGNA